MTGQVHLELYSCPGVPLSGPTGTPSHSPEREEGLESRKEKKEEHRRGWAASLGPIRGTHRERVIMKCTESDRNERIR